MLGSRLVGRQLSLILREVVYDEWGKRPSELVTVQRDGRPLSVVSGQQPVVSENQKTHQSTAGGMGGTPHFPEMGKCDHPTPDYIFSGT
jgi:hypothetical protein